MKKLLIIKTGSTFPEIKELYGDFEEQVLQQMGIPAKDVMVASVYKGEKLTGIDDISAIVITGSHSMVTEREAWSVSLAEWLQSVRKLPIPILGICYGHQLLADAFGGIVDYHPGGVEMGSVDIALSTDGKNDILLSVLPERFPGYASHAQTVLKLPEGAKLLARNEFEPHHAFVLDGHIWGVQFHPEFNKGITCSYIEAEREALMQQGRDVDALLRSVEENEYGKILLRQFIKLAI